MILHKQQFEGVWLIEAEPITDNRGAFYRHFCQKEFQKFGLEPKIVQTNISENKKKKYIKGISLSTASS